MILFLDFDGVLHPEIIGVPDDFVCRPHLWKILRTCLDVDVVFSTSWRDMHSVQELINFSLLKAAVKTSRIASSAPHRTSSTNQAHSAPGRIFAAKASAACG